MDKPIKVTCIDGDTLSGIWSNWTSEQDNEPDGESITIDLDDGCPVEIFIVDIDRIEAVEGQAGTRASA
jgi:hypothetical protein